MPVLGKGIPMANDRYCFLVLEESLPQGTIAEHRKARQPKPKRLSRTKRARQPTDLPQPSPRPRPSA
jgi:hypothetical protein